MNNGLNKVMLIGTIDGGIELRRTNSGRPVASFTVATIHTLFADDGGRYDTTEWFNVISWGSLAEQCDQQLHNGDRLYVEGRLHTRSWEDDNNVTHFRTEVVAQDIVIM